MTTKPEPCLFLVTVTKRHYVLAHSQGDAVEAVKDAHYDGSHASTYRGVVATGASLARDGCADKEPHVEMSLIQEIHWEPRTCRDWVKP